MWVVAFRLPYPTLPYPTCFPALTVESNRESRFFCRDCCCRSELAECGGWTSAVRGGVGGSVSDKAAVDGAVPAASAAPAAQLHRAIRAFSVRRRPMLFFHRLCLHPTWLLFTSSHIPSSSHTLLILTGRRVVCWKVVSYIFPSRWKALSHIFPHTFQDVTGFHLMDC